MTPLVAWAYAFADFAFDFKRQLQESRRTNLVQHAGHVAVDGLRVTSNENLCLWVGLINLLQPGKDLLKLDHLFVEIVRALFVHRQADVVLLRLDFPRGTFRQYYFP